MASSSVIQSGLPFSMKWNSIRQGAGGMSIPKAKTEGFDNDIDAHATVTYTKSWVDKMTKTTYLLDFNNGDGLDDLPHLFGLGTKTPKKPETMIGNYNHGHTAMVGFFNPTSYQAYSKTVSSAPSVLDFRVQAFDSAVASLSCGSGSSDYRSVDVNKFMSVSTSVTDINSTLSYIANSIRNTDMKTFLQQIIAGTAPHFLLNLYSFNSSHRFSKELVDDEMANTFPSLSLTYHDPLVNGYQIVTEFNPVDDKPPVIKKTDGSKVLSPICSRETFPAINFLCKMYASDNEDYVHISVRLDNGEYKDLYLSNRQSDARKTVNTVLPTAFCADHWKTSAFSYEGDFLLEVNCPSEAVFTAFSNSLGTDLNGVDNTRGIYTRFMKRGGGKPFWMPGGINNGGWPAARNSGRIGALLQTRRKRIAEEYLGLQSNKHNTDLSSAHPLVKRFLTIVMRNIIEKYTNYRLPTSKTGIKKWVLNDVCDMLMEKKKPKTPSPPYPVAPVLPSASSTSPDSDDDGSEASVASPVSSPAPAPAPVSAPAEMAVPEMSSRPAMPPLSASVVPQHTRTQPQSEKSYLNFIKALITNTTPEEIDAMMENASERTMDGFAEKCRAIKEVQNYLDSKKRQ